MLQCFPPFRLSARLYVCKVVLAWSRAVCLCTVDRQTMLLRLLSTRRNTRPSAGMQLVSSQHCNTLQQLKFRERMYNTEIKIFNFIYLIKKMGTCVQIASIKRTAIFHTLYLRSNNPSLIKTEKACHKLHTLQIQAHPKHLYIRLPATSHQIH